jgi:hypothetical protein
VVFVAVTGCAHLKVTKVSAEKRANGEDQHVKGFRYYLSRPYVVVTEPVLVSEQTALYVYRALQGAETIAEPIKEKMTRINPASGAFEMVSDAELAALRQIMEPQSGVRQVGHKTPPPSATVIVNAQAAGLPRVGDASAQAADTVADVNETILGRTGGSAGGLRDTKVVGDTGGGGHLTTPTLTPTDPATVSLSGKIQVVFLPDLDEQYAVHNCNLLSKSAYSLNFRDGWALTDVSGEFDSTAVPIQILNFIDSAIDAAKSVGLASVDRMARVLAGDHADVTKLRADLDNKQAYVYQVVHSIYLRPGVYRINKPWEIAQTTEVCGAGFLVKLGLATFETTRIERYSDNEQLKDMSILRHSCICGEADPCNQ